MITYLFDFTIWLLVFYLCYKFLFLTTKKFKFIRFYLLCALVASAILPIVNFELPTEAIIPFQKEVISLAESNLSAAHFEEDLDTLPSNQSFINFESVIVGIYLLGVLFMLWRYFSNLDQLSSRIKGSKLINKKSYQLVLMKEQERPFSFLNFIFLNEIDYEEGKLSNSIILHEEIHVNQKHSLDILFIELFLVVLYFHPLMWFYRRSIQMNHEFLADKEVLKETDFGEYSSLILNSVTCTMRPNFSCSFNQSFIKNRIIMLTEPKTRNRVFRRNLVVTVCLFSVVFLLTCFTYSNEKNISAIEKDYTVVIDLGHGGKDPGTSNKDLGISEEQILTSIGNEIKQLETSFEVIFTRNSNNFVSLEDRVKLVNKK